MKITVDKSKRQSMAHRLATSIKLRLVVVFLLLAAAMTAVFIGGAQRAFAFGWREAARPLVTDYIDYLMSQVAPDFATPNIDNAAALSKRLPITILISGPQANWSSHPKQEIPSWKHDQANEDLDLRTILIRQTADGHTVTFGIDESVFEQRPRQIIFTVATLLLLTLFAWWYVHRQMQPLDDIRAGAKRFGNGKFDQSIKIKKSKYLDELGELAVTVNTMGNDIKQMLLAKDALLLAISHEIRSPLTRARVNVELLPDAQDVILHREAIRRDLIAMAKLIEDLLESERLSGSYSVLHRTEVNLIDLIEDVVSDLKSHYAGGSICLIKIIHTQDQNFHTVQLDASRIRLYIRNLLENALLHSSDIESPPEIRIQMIKDDVLRIEVRDYGAGLSEDQIPFLAQPFYRPETARSRTTGGVGLGLYLCKLVAIAHGGEFEIKNACPGLSVVAHLPCA